MWALVLQLSLQPWRASRSIEIHSGLVFSHGNFEIRMRLFQLLERCSKPSSVASKTVTPSTLFVSYSTLFTEFVFRLFSLACMPFRQLTTALTTPSTYVSYWVRHQPMAHGSTGSPLSPAVLALSRLDNTTAARIYVRLSFAKD